MARVVFTSGKYRYAIFIFILFPLLVLNLFSSPQLNFLNLFLPRHATCYRKLQRSSTTFAGLHHISSTKPLSYAPPAYLSQIFPFCPIRSLEVTVKNLIVLRPGLFADMP